MGKWQEYLETTKYMNLPESQQDKGEPQPPLQMPYDPSANLIQLPDGKDCPIDCLGFKKLVEARTSLRKYSQEALTLKELGYLLWATQGVKEVHKSKQFTLRTVPSAGARHPFETYVLINNVEGLVQGLYRYLALEHALILVNDDPSINKIITEGCFGQKQVANSAVTFCWAADIARTYWRYSERSYRYVLLDAGHVCQNLYLAAESIGSGVCAIAAFDDDGMDAALGLDGIHQFTVYIASLGKRA